MVICVWPFCYSIVNLAASFSSGASQEIFFQGLMGKGLLVLELKDLGLESLLSRGSLGVCHLAPDSLLPLRAATIHLYSEQ